MRVAEFSFILVLLSSSQSNHPFMAPSREIGTVLVGIFDAKKHKFKVSYHRFIDNFVSSVKDV